LKGVYYDFGWRGQLSPECREKSVLRVVDERRLEMARDMVQVSTEEKILHG
jgi:hypothetical protein